MMIDIRKAEKGDEAGIFDLIKGNAVNGQLMAVPVVNLKKNITEFIVAEENNRIVGCGAFHHHTGNIFEICSMSVRGDKQNTGIGKGIITKILSTVSGEMFVFLCTDKPDYYQRFGFEKIGLFDLPLSVRINKLKNVFEQNPKEVLKILFKDYSYMKLSKNRLHQQ